MTLRQDRFVIAPARARAALPPRSWQVPVAIGPLSATQPAQSLLLDGSAEIAAGSCGEAIKVNLGDIGYYRVEYGPTQPRRAGEVAGADGAGGPRSISSPIAGRWCRPAAPSRHPISRWSRASASTTIARSGIR